ncbi:MAG: Hsp20/alpha crystallin family protein [Chloroflexota bacterium]|nr:MAG: Hsp20/alpha crystallin family protein [Chloroflexota bacterium]
MTDESKSMQVQEQEMVPEVRTERIRERACFVPRADVFETEENVFVVVDMPGVNDENIEITLDNNILTIYGNTTLERPEGYSLAFVEYEVGDYERSFRLTDRIDREAIEATYKDGVLHLTLPKAEEAKVRKISVKAG